LIATSGGIFTYDPTSDAATRLAVGGGAPIVTDLIKTTGNEVLAGIVGQGVTAIPTKASALDAHEALPLAQRIKLAVSADGLTVYAAEIGDYSKLTARSNMTDTVVLDSVADIDSDTELTSGRLQQSRRS